MLFLDDFRRVMETASIGYMSIEQVDGGAGNPSVFRCGDTNGFLASVVDFVGGWPEGLLVCPDIPEDEDPIQQWLSFLDHGIQENGPRTAKFYTGKTKKWFQVELLWLDNGCGAILLTEQEALCPGRGIHYCERDLLAGGPLAAFQWQYSKDQSATEFVSENIFRILGYEPEIFTKPGFERLDWIYADDRERYLREIRWGLRMGRSPIELEYRYLHRDGSWRWIREHAIVESVSTDSEAVLRSYIQDITEARHSEEALKKQIEAERLVADSSSLLANIDTGNIQERVNDALLLIGEFFRVDRSYIFRYNEESKEVDNSFEWCAPGVFRQMYQLQHIDIDRYPWFRDQLLESGILLIGNLQHIPDAAESEQQFLEEMGTHSILCLPMTRNEKYVGFLGLDTVKEDKFWAPEEIALLRVLNSIISDALNRHQSELEIRYLSYHDKLTGLYNRRYFEDELARLDEAESLPMTVLVGDVNGLKITNDVFGHIAGDRLLVTIAAILKNSCRPTDIIARWGGDEFVVLLPNTEAAEVEALCQRIGEGCESQDDLPFKISISLGFCTKSVPEDSIRRVMNIAEDRMYRQKLIEGGAFRSSVIRKLIETMDEKRLESAGHAERMRDISVRIARCMALPEEEEDQLSLLAMMHDIGKVAISEQTLSKVTPLTEEEWVDIQRHSEIGYRIAQSSPELGRVANLILSHHERWDGSGYPQGLKGAAIPKLSRIISVVDAFDAMTHERPYKGAISEASALEEIQRCAGTQFDPEIVKVFAAIMVVS